MGVNIDEHSVIAETKLYWANVNEAMRLDKHEIYLTKLLPENYIKGLLRKEIEYARNRNALPGVTCRYLAMLVGLSFEPLLQSVKVYGPEKVILILNNEYGENTDGALIGMQLKNLLLSEHMGFKEQDIACEILDDSSPTAVFRTLLSCFKAQPELNESVAGSEVSEERRRFILDVTGGKKSMVSGAFLFGAYADIPISYVDFDKYDRQYGKPYGYTCRIGFLSNPYRLFQLSNWHKIEELYRHYAFHSCVEILNNIGSGSQDKPVFDRDQLEAIDKLKNVLSMYDLWDNGDYKGALQKFNAIRQQVAGITTPLAVTELGGRWPTGGSGFNPAPGCAQRGDITESVLNELKDLEFGKTGEFESLYHRLDLTILYAKDELGKIERLIRFKKDYRSALLRAAGLNEFLSKARTIALWNLNCMEIKILKEEFLNKEEAFIRNKIFNYLIKKAMNLTYTTIFAGEYANVPHMGQPDFTIKLNNSANSLTFERSWNDLINQHNDFINKEKELARLRNKTIHTCLPIAESLAEQGWALAKAHFDNFYEWASDVLSSQDRSLDLEDEDFAAIEWEELCASCRVDFLPPKDN